MNDAQFVPVLERRLRCEGCRQRICISVESTTGNGHACPRCRAQRETAAARLIGPPTPPVDERSYYDVPAWVAPAFNGNGSH